MEKSVIKEKKSHLQKIYHISPKKVLSTFQDGTLQPQT